MKKLQIGVMGSAYDLKYSDDALNFAKELGRKIMEQRRNILLYLLKQLKLQVVVVVLL